MSLIDTWLAAGKANGCKTNKEVLEDLNNDLSLNVLNNRLYEWKNGTVKPSAVVINYMLKTSILYALQKIKPRFRLTSAEQCLLMEMLSTPEKEKIND